MIDNWHLLNQNRIISVDLFDFLTRMIKIIWYAFYCILNVWMFYGLTVVLCIKQVNLLICITLLSVFMNYFNMFLLMHHFHFIIDCLNWINVIYISQMLHMYLSKSNCCTIFFQFHTPGLKNKIKLKLYPEQFS